MGLDEALLTEAGVPTLRLYGWSPAAISLGRFQTPAVLTPLAEGTVIVRRITGGGAIHHADEITFALVLEAAHLPGSIAASYDLLHRAIARALATVGVPAACAGGGGAGTARPGEPWCFREPSCFDLVLPDGRKILGSAQRRVRRPRSMILHHGSLPLTTPPLTPWCGAVGDFVDAIANADRLRAAIVDEIAAALQLTPIEAPLTNPELRRAHALAINNYADLATSQPGAPLD